MDQKIINSTLDTIDDIENNVITFYPRDAYLLYILGKKYYTLTKNTHKNTSTLEKSKLYLLKSLCIQNTIQALYSLSVILTTVEEFHMFIVPRLSIHPIEHKLKVLSLTVHRFPKFAYEQYTRLVNKSRPNQEINFHIYETLVFLSTIQHTNVAMIKSLEYCKNALDIKRTDALVANFFLSNCCVSTPKKLPFDMNTYFNVEKYISIMPNKRIHIGFLLPFIKSHKVFRFCFNMINILDNDSFNVFVYHETDTYITLRSNRNVKWFSLKNMNHTVAYSYIHDIHRIDILFDIFAFGHIRTRLLAKMPAKTIINYPCFPNEIESNYYTHINLPLNYALPPGDATPIIDFQQDTEIFPNDQTIVGIMAGPEKITIKFITMLNKIASTHNVIFCVNSTKEIPFLKNAVYIERRIDYYNIYNTLDYVIDTYPYSCISTSADSLFMGCPVLSLKKDDTPNKLIKFSFVKYRDNYRRKQIRKRFINENNPTIFKKIFTGCLNKIYQNNLKNANSV